MQSIGTTGKKHKTPGKLLISETFAVIRNVVSVNKQKEGRKIYRLVLRKL